MGLISPDFGLLLWAFFSIAALTLALIALIDIVRSRFKDSDKLVWIIVVIFVLLIGPILYFSIGKKQKIKDN